MRCCEHGETLACGDGKSLFKGLSHGNVGLDSPARALMLNHAQWKHFFSEVAAHRKMCEILREIQKWLHPSSRLWVKTSMVKTTSKEINTHIGTSAIPYAKHWPRVTPRIKTSRLTVVSHAAVQLSVVSHAAVQLSKPCSRAAVGAISHAAVQPRSLIKL